MLPKHLYRHAIIMTERGAYAYKSFKWAEANGDAIVDYATTDEMARNLTIDYIQARGGVPFPMQHSMIYYERLLLDCERQYKYFQTQKWGRLWNFEFQCHLEERQQFYEHLRAARELTDDLWRLNNRAQFIKGFRMNTHAMSSAAICAIRETS